MPSTSVAWMILDKIKSLNHFFLHNIQTRKFFSNKLNIILILASKHKMYSDFRTHKMVSGFVSFPQVFRKFFGFTYTLMSDAFLFDNIPSYRYLRMRDRCTCFSSGMENRSLFDLSVIPEQNSVVNGWEQLCVRWDSGRHCLEVQGFDFLVEHIPWTLS